MADEQRCASIDRAQSAERGNHDWETGKWGVIIGVSKCRRCGRIAHAEDFPMLAKAQAHES